MQGEKRGDAGYGHRLYTSSTREEKLSQLMCLKYTKYLHAIPSNYKTTLKKSIIPMSEALKLAINFRKPGN